MKNSSLDSTTFVFNLLKTCVAKCEHTSENTHMNRFYLFRQQGNVIHLKDMLYNLFYFPQNSIYVIILSFCSNNTFFINHAMKFKYPTQLVNC